MELSDIPVFEIILRVLIIFALALFGIVAKFLGIIDSRTCASLSNILIYFTYPSLIFSSITSEVKWERLVSGFLTPVLTVVVVAAMFLMGKIFARLLKQNSQTSRVFVLLCSIPNSGFLGIAVIYSLLGEVAMPFAVLYEFGLGLFFWTVIIGQLRDDKTAGLGASLKKLLNPAIIATLVGLIINFFKIPLPEIITVPVKTMGSANTPLAMLLVGYTLTTLQFKPGNVWNLVTLSFLKLAICPLIAYLIMMPFRIDPMVRMVILIQSTMPSMSSTSVFALKYGGDVDFSTTTVLVTTVLSIITIPLFIFILF